MPINPTHPNHSPNINAEQNATIAALAIATILLIAGLAFAYYYNTPSTAPLTTETIDNTSGRADLHDDGVPAPANMDMARRSDTVTTDNSGAGVLTTNPSNVENNNGASAP